MSVIGFAKREALAYAEQLAATHSLEIQEYWGEAQNVTASRGVEYRPREIRGAGVRIQYQQEVGFKRHQRTTRAKARPAP